MLLWNHKNLPAPPTNTYKSKTQDIDLLKLRNAIQDGIKHFKNEDFMIREVAIMSRILYRMKMKFRSAKEFKSLEKIKHSLVIYLNTNMARDLKNMLDLIPSKYKLETYLPTRNMLSYILVRIQGFVKLMERVYDTCLVAASEINKRIAIGHFWKIYLVLFALVSRIYILVKFNTKYLCEFYGKLFSHYKKLENSGRNWLPDGYKLPIDLREWLEVKWVYEEDYIDLTAIEPTMKIIDFFDLVDDDDDDVEFCDEYVLIDEEDRNIANDFKKLKPVQETFTNNRMRGFSINEDDIGEDLADIITLDDTVGEKSHLRNEKNDQRIFNAPCDLQDAGEEISDSEAHNNKKGEDTNDTVIDLIQDSMLIDTPKDTPDEIIRKTSNEINKSSNNLSVIVLDDTLATRTVSWDEFNKSINPKKKKKKKSNKNRADDSMLSNNNPSNGVSKKQKNNQTPHKTGRDPDVRKTVSINLTPKNAKKIKKSKNKKKSQEDPKILKDSEACLQNSEKNTNVVRLTLVKNTTKTEQKNVNQKSDLNCSKSGNDKRSEINDSFVPRLETPLTCKLKIGEKTINIEGKTDNKKTRNNDKTHKSLIHLDSSTKQSPETKSKKKRIKALENKSTDLSLICLDTPVKKSSKTEFKSKNYPIDNSTPSCSKTRSEDDMKSGTAMNGKKRKPDDSENNDSAEKIKKRNSQETVSKFFRRDIEDVSAGSSTEEEQKPAKKKIKNRIRFRHGRKRRKF